MKKEIAEYAIILKVGEPEEKFIRHISLEGGREIIKILTSSPLQPFISVKGKMIATSMIAQLIPVYKNEL